MRPKDVLILLAPVAIGVLAMALMVIPGVLLPVASPIGPAPAALAANPAATTPQAAGTPATAAAPTKGVAGQATAPPAAAPAGKGDPEHGKALFGSKPCATCHTIADIPAAVGKVGPDLTHIGTVAATRKPGMDAEAYIRESIQNPTAFTVPGFPAGVMPANLVSGSDLDDVVAMLLQHK